MKKNYTFNNRNFFPYIYDEALEEYVLTYKDIFTMLIPFLEMFMQGPYHLQLQGKKESHQKVSWMDAIENDFQFEFLISNRNTNLNLSITKDKIEIKHQNEEYILSLSKDDAKTYIQIKEYCIFDNQQKIRQKITSQYYCLEIQTNEKIYSLNIPYETQQFLNTHLFANIDKNSNIVDLRKLYRSYFYHLQSAFELQLDTELSIYLVHNDQKVLIDSLILKNGFIKEYMLGSYNDGMIIKLIGKVNGECKLLIDNYLPDNKTDICKEAQTLYKRSRIINLD